jgi:RNA polymerase sigma factor (sigma-70 family)
MEHSYSIYRREAERLEKEGKGLYEKHLLYVVKIVWNFIRINNSKCLYISNVKKVTVTKHDSHPFNNFIMDLIQEGNIGLMKAVEKYDENYGAKFTTYAYKWIVIYIQRYIDKIKVKQKEIDDNIEIENILKRSDEIKKICLENDLISAINDLDEKEKKVIKYRIGNDISSSLTFKQIAAIMKISYESVRLIEKQAVIKIREKLWCIK